VTQETSEVCAYVCESNAHAFNQRNGPEEGEHPKGKHIDAVFIGLAFVVLPRMLYVR
jgi:hypothetical protein